MNKKKKEKPDSAISIETSTQVDLFEVLCSTSSSEEACRRFVDRLETASTNISRKSSSS